MQNNLFSIVFTLVFVLFATACGEEVKTIIESSDEFVYKTRTFDEPDASEADAEANVVEADADADAEVDEEDIRTDVNVESDVSEADTMPDVAEVDTGADVVEVDAEVDTDANEILSFLLSVVWTEPVLPPVIIDDNVDNDVVLGVLRLCATNGNANLRQVALRFNGSFSTRDVVVNYRNGNTVLRGIDTNGGGSILFSQGFEIVSETCEDIELVTHVNWVNQWFDWSRVFYTEVLTSSLTSVVRTPESGSRLVVAHPQSILRVNNDGYEVTPPNCAYQLHKCACWAVQSWRLASGASDCPLNDDAS